MTIHLSRPALAVALALVALGAGAAALRAQAPPPPALPVGVADLYRVEEEAPQFVEARARIAELQTRQDAVMRAVVPYRFLTPEQLDEVVALERVPAGRTREQRERLDALAGVDETSAKRYRELLTLPEDRRTPDTDAEFGTLSALYDSCKQHQDELLTKAREDLALSIRQHEGSVTAQLDAAFRAVAEAKGLALILESRVEASGGSAEPGLTGLGRQFRRIVHYGGVDVTADVIAELIRLNNAARGIPGP